MTFIWVLPVGLSYLGTLIDCSIIAHDILRGFGQHVLTSAATTVYILRKIFLRYIQKTISQDYISHGQAVSVSCPAFVDASTQGTFYTCDATTAIGTVKQVWVSIDGADGQFSYSLAVHG